MCGIDDRTASAGLASQLQRIGESALERLRTHCDCWMPEFRRSSPAEGMMLSHCANSQCSTPFLRLRQGKLFLVETACVVKTGEVMPPSSPYTRQRPLRVERYWLCDQCAEVWTLVHDQSQGIVLVPLPGGQVGARGAMAEQC